MFTHFFVVCNPCSTVPERVGDIDVAVVGGKLNISWSSTPEPNDFLWNYTVLVTNSRTGDTILRRELSMNITEHIIYEPHPQLGINLFFFVFFAYQANSVVEGVSYDVSVFVTNGKGNSATVSKQFLGK